MPSSFCASSAPGSGFFVSVIFGHVSNEPSWAFRLSGHEPVSFDAFYLAMQKFRLGQRIDFEKAAEDAISFLERRPEAVL